MGDDFALIGIGVVLTILYMVMGIGTARMLAKIKGRDIRLFDVFGWIIVMVVFASVGDCE